MTRSTRNCTARTRLRAPRRRSTSHPLLLDLLERRMLLSSITWTGNAGDNNWDTPANWSSDAVPTGL